MMASTPHWFSNAIPQPLSTFKLLSDFTIANTGIGDAN